MALVPPDPATTKQAAGGGGASVLRDQGSHDGKDAPPEDDRDALQLYSELPLQHVEAAATRNDSGSSSRHRRRRGEGRMDGGDFSSSWPVDRRDSCLRRPMKR